MASATSMNHKATNDNNIQTRLYNGLVRQKTVLYQMDLLSVRSGVGGAFPTQFQRTRILAIDKMTYKPLNGSDSMQEHGWRSALNIELAASCCKNATCRLLETSTMAKAQKPSLHGLVYRQPSTECP